MIPSGTVVFLFTDIEGSTVRWDAHREAMQLALRRHDAILRAAVESHNGYVFKTVGDAFCVAFAGVRDAIEAAVDAQRHIAAEDFSSVDGLRVRMAVHAGETDERSGDYFGPVVNRVARLLSVGHGGQVLLSGFARELSVASLPSDVTVHRLGTLPLKDLKEPEHVFQLIAPGLETTFRPLRALETPPNNLPHQPTSFVGRHADLARIEELARTNALVTIAGTGGAGKTRLALEAARAILNDRHDGAWFVDLAPIADPLLVASAILTVLDVNQSDDRPALDVLLEHLKTRDLLLIMDNCEHVVAEAARVAAAILAHAPYVTVLTTSREPLDVTGERLYRLGSLDAESAAALFADRALAADAEFRIDLANAPVVADICRRLDGIAFAIELAAARLRSFSLDELSRRLELRILSGGRDRQPRQQTMRALIDWGYDVLSEDEKAVFRRLSVFAGGFTLDAARSVAGDEPPDEIEALELLTSLSDKSLLVAGADETGQRYRMLELIRQYTREKLDESGETPPARRRHAHAYAAVAHAGYEEWETDPRPNWLARLARELDNVRAALHWSIAEEHDPELGAALAGNVAPIFMRLSLLREGINWGERALSAAKLDGIAEARLQYALSMLYNNQAAQEKTLAAATRAAELFRSAGDSRGLARALWQMAAKLAMKSQFDAAQRAAAESIELARALGDPLLLARALQHCAYAYEPEIDRARELLREAVAIFRSLKRNDDTARALMWWAQLEAQVGAYDKAIEIAGEAEPMADENLMMYASNSVAGYYAALGDGPNGAPVAREAFRLAVRNEHPFLAAMAVLYIAASATAAQAADATRLLGYAEKNFRENGWQPTGYDRVTHENLLNALRARVAAFDSFLEEGAAWNQEQAVAYVARF